VDISYAYFFRISRNTTTAAPTTRSITAGSMSGWLSSGCAGGEGETRTTIGWLGRDDGGEDAIGFGVAVGLIDGKGDGAADGQGANSQSGPVLPTADPSGQILASVVQATGDGEGEGLGVGDGVKGGAKATCAATFAVQQPLLSVPLTPVTV